MLVDPPHLVEAKKRVGPIDSIGLGLIAVGLGALEYVLDKGQEEDWFNSHTIVIFSAIAAVSLVSFVLWEWRQEHPVVEVRLFKNGTFAVSSLMMLVLGMALYGSTVLLPLTPANNYTPTVMIMGGASPSTATTELIDLSKSPLAWSFGPSMSQPRIEVSVTIRFSLAR